MRILKIMSFTFILGLLGTLWMGKIEDKELFITKKSVKIIATRAFYDVVKQEPYAGFAQGTGVFIGKRLILTENHVVTHANQVLILRANEDTLTPAVIVNASPEKDFAILTVLSDEDNDIAEISNREAKIGDEVTTIGNAGLDFEVQSARVGGISLFNHWGLDFREMLVLDNKSIRPGFSGGAVFGKDGKIVGMVEALGIDGYPLAIKSKEILEFLRHQKKVK